MVSKSTILGQSSLIFISIGTTSFTFVRLLETIDKVLIQTKSQSYVVAQIENSHYKWKHPFVYTTPSLTPLQMHRYIKRSEKIVIHGGPGTLYTVSRYSRYMPLSIARLSKYNEHVNDHQKHFLKYLRTQLPKKYHRFFVFDSNALTAVKHYLKEDGTENILQKYLFNKEPSKKLLYKLNHYLSNLET